MQHICQLVPNASRIFSRNVAALHTRSFVTSIPRLQAVGGRKPFLDEEIHDKLRYHNQKQKLDSAAPRTQDDIWAARSAQALSSLSEPKDAYAGRRVQVASKGAVADALRKLDGILSRNNVRQELRLQERHEKKGVKRRRLQSERWRKHFANEVRKKVALVLRIKNHGA